MKQKSLVQNAIWNFFYSGINIIFPLLTAPYVSRVLGAANLGEVDFAKSFVLWFVTFASFGVNTYGVREIAAHRESPEKMNKIFSELFTINLIFSLISTFLYLIIIINVESFHEQQYLFIVMALSVILNSFNIDWFYQGIEEYSYITIRNAVIKLLSLASIFIFIINESDYIIYGLISVLGTSLSGILNVFNSRKYVSYSLKKTNIFKHLKALSTFYFITLIISLYTNLDKTALGFFDTSESVAYLARAKMTTSVAVTISSSIAAVGMPRAAYYLKTNMEKYRALIVQIPKVMMFLTIPITMGIVLLAPEIMLILGGVEFLPATNLLRIISLTVIFSSLSAFLHSQVLVASGNEKIGLWASVISSIISILANFILIPLFSYTGAGYALLLAEFSAVLSRYILAKKIGVNYVSLINLSTVKFTFAALCMVLPVLIIKGLFESVILIFVISAFLGGVIYFVVLFLMKEKTVLYFINLMLKKTPSKL